MANIIIKDTDITSVSHEVDKLKTIIINTNLSKKDKDELIKKINDIHYHLHDMWIKAETAKKPYIGLNQAQTT